MYMLNNEDEEEKKKRQRARERKTKVAMSKVFLSYFYMFSFTKIKVQFKEFPRCLRREFSYITENAYDLLSQMLCYDPDVGLNPRTKQRKTRKRPKRRKAKESALPQFSLSLSLSFFLSFFFFVLALETHQCKRRVGSPVFLGSAGPHEARAFPLLARQV